MNKNLIIFPGGGDPENTKYNKVYSLIENEAKKRNYNEIFIAKWPGHKSFNDNAKEVIKMDTSLENAILYLNEFEKKGKKYDVICRSYGCSVLMAALNNTSLNNLDRIVLWGPPAHHVFYEMYVINLEETKKEAYLKGANVNFDSFLSSIPIEYLIKEYNKKNLLIIAYGTEDKFCTPDFVKFLKSLPKKYFTITDNIINNLKKAGVDEKITESLKPLNKDFNKKNFEEELSNLKISNEQKELVMKHALTKNENISFREVIGCPHEIEEENEFYFKALFE